MQDSKKNTSNTKNNNLKNNNSNNNLIGLAIFVGVLIFMIIMFVIFTKAILPNSEGSSNKSPASNSNLGIHTGTTTEPVTLKTENSGSSKNDIYDNEYDNDFDDDDYNYNQQGGTIMSVKSDVNVRSGPGSSYDQIGELTAGTEVTVYENKNGWYRISFNGSNNAYVFSDYISGALPEATTSTSGYNSYTETSPTYTSYAQLNQ